MTHITLFLPFGYRNGSAIFQHISDGVHHIMRQRPFDIVNYVDDILGIDLPSRIDASFNALGHLLQDLRIHLSQKKLQAPTTCLNCSGILVNTEDFTVSIQLEKLQEI